MKLPLIPMLMLCASVLLASCASTPLAVKPTLTEPSVVLLKECDKPRVLPKEGLTASRVEHYWLHDRASLLSCIEAKNSVQDYYLTRDRLLSGTR